MFFDLQNEEPVVTPEALFVPEFRDVWDRFENKEDAHIYFIYIYHMEAMRSNYAVLSKEERAAAVKHDYLQKVPSWPEPKWLGKAREKYKKFQTNHEIRALEGGLELLDKLTTYYKDLDFSQKDDKGQLVHNPSTAMRSVKDLEGTVKSIKKLKAEVAKDLDQLSQETYGDKELNMFDTAL